MEKMEWRVAPIECAFRSDCLLYFFFYEVRNICMECARCCEFKFS